MVPAKAVTNGTTMCRMINQSTTVNLLVIVQARRFTLFSHTARMPDQTDAKILYSFHL